MPVACFPVTGSWGNSAELGYRIGTPVEQGSHASNLQDRITNWQKLPNPGAEKTIGHLYSLLGREGPGSSVQSFCDPRNGFPYR